MFFPLLNAFLSEAKDDFLGKLEETEAETAMDEWDACTKDVCDLFG